MRKRWEIKWSRPNRRENLHIKRALAVVSVGGLTCLSQSASFWDIESSGRSNGIVDYIFSTVCSWVSVDYMHLTLSLAIFFSSQIMLSLM
ncbi:hypothetical protein BDV25DRAFT_161770 [Aspergillus avenaceus]|uniref:Uncharacterized protein n=1 Tax=Aspergillus avenaceus TaxID=36643 RepID=A0A5N6TK95_ASPAV|nr:hypothetical protein BDV25DRAFT_161770 [Aspergillus avenaceus]